MTVISEPVANIATGGDPNAGFLFSVPLLRENAATTGMVTTRTEHVYAVGGVLTTPDFDPGPATVRIGQRVYAIEIPNSPTPVRLWPLIEAGLPVPPVEEMAAVRNAGGVARAKRLTLAEYQASTPDPDTLYVII